MGLFNLVGVPMNLHKPPPARKESSALFLQREMHDIIKSEPALIEGITAMIAEALVSGWRKRGALYIPADPATIRPGLEK